MSKPLQNHIFLEVPLGNWQPLKILLYLSNVKAYYFIFKKKEKKKKRKLYSFRGIHPSLMWRHKESSFHSLQYIIFPVLSIYTHDVTEL